MSQTIKQENEKIEIQSLNLCVQIINNITPNKLQPDAQLSTITNLTQLSKRLQIANQKHQHQRKIKKQAEEWIRESGINLKKIQSITEEYKREIKQKEPPLSNETWNNIEYQELKNVDSHNFGRMYEERLANFGIMMVLSKGKNTRIRDIRGKILMKLANQKETIHEAKYEIRKKQQQDRRKDREIIYPEILRKLILDDRLEKFEDLHIELQNKFRHHQMRWLDSLSLQIKEEKKLREMKKGEISQYQDKIKIHIVVSSLKSLQKIYLQIFQKSELTQRSLLGESYAETDDNRICADAYFSLRCGNFEKLQLILGSRSDLRKTIKQDYKIFLKNLYNYDPKPVFSLDVKHSDQFFEKQLKLILKGGRYERPPKGIIKELQLLDQPWLILMNLGLYLKLNRSEEDQMVHNQYKNAIYKYLRSINDRDCNQNAINKSTISGLICLTAYDEIFEFYSDFVQNHDLLSEFDYIHLIILFYTNPRVLKSGVNLEKNKQFFVFLDKCRQKISSFAKKFVHSNPDNFMTYFLLILWQEYVLQLEKFTKRQDFFQNIAQVCQFLFQEMSDIKSIKFNAIQIFFSQVDDGQEISEKIYKYILNSVRAESYQDYYDLALCCKQVGLDDQCQRYFYKLLIIAYLDQEKKRRNRQQDESTLFKQSKNQLEFQKRDIFLIKEVERSLVTEEMEGKLNEQNISLLHFLQDLKNYRDLLYQRNFSRLFMISQRWRLQSRECDAYQLQVVLEYLKSLNNSSESISYLQIYLSYYEKLIDLHQIKHLMSSNVAQLREQKLKMKKEMEILRNTYPNIKGQEYGRIYQLLDQ